MQSWAWIWRKQLDFQKIRFAGEKQFTIWIQASRVGHPSCCILSCVRWGFGPSWQTWSARLVVVASLKWEPIEHSTWLPKPLIDVTVFVNATNGEDDEFTELTRPPNCDTVWIVKGKVVKEECWGIGILLRRVGNQILKSCQYFIFVHAIGCLHILIWLPTKGCWSQEHSLPGNLI